MERFFRDIFGFIVSVADCFHFCLLFWRQVATLLDHGRYTLGNLVPFEHHRLAVGLLELDTLGIMVFRAVKSTGDARHAATNAIYVFQKVCTLCVRMLLLKELIYSEASAAITALASFNDRIDFIIGDEAANGRDFAHLRIVIPAWHRVFFHRHNTFSDIRQAEAHQFTVSFISSIEGADFIGDYRILVRIGEKFFNSGNCVRKAAAAHIA